ncbi:MAG: phosphatase PAP2 family protein [Acidimicrobiales bacterium]
MSSAAAAQARLQWWREVVYIAAFYGVYTLVRNYGVATDSARDAFANAVDVIHLERLLGSFHEQAIQRRFLDARWFIAFWNVFYGTAHFAVTAGALIWLFRRQPARYPLWRNTLAAATAFALAGFAFFPLMPPRLLPASYGFVDTLAEIGGLWSFDSGTMQQISNQYAAMPSLHFAWAGWCVCVLWPGMGRPPARLAVAAYPLATLFAIVVTANHFWFDAAGGAAVLLVGFVVALAVTREPPPPGPGPADLADEWPPRHDLRHPQAGAAP